MKRLRWSAVLLGLVLATSWAGAAQATTNTTPGETTTTTVGATTTTTVGATTTTVGATTTTVGATTTTTEPGGNEQPCSAEEGLESFSGISAETTGEHPTASVKFTIKEGCIVQLALVSFTGLLDEPGEFVDVAPPEEKDSFFGPGEHSLTVRLPTCSRFSVLFFGFPVNQPRALDSQGQSYSFSKPSVGGVRTLAATQEPELTVIDAIDGETTNCPTESTNPEVVPTTVVQVTTPTQQGLPDTGTNAMPILIAGLVLVAGGAAALLASRARSRQAK